MGQRVVMLSTDVPLTYGMGWVGMGLPWQVYISCCQLSCTVRLAWLAVGRQAGYRWAVAVGSARQESVCARCL